MAIARAFLIMVLLYSQLYNSLVFGHYQTNYNYFIERCENTDKPELKCNGKCLLAQKFAQESEPKSQKPEPPLAQISLRYVLPHFSMDALLNFPLKDIAFNSFKQTLPELLFAQIPSPPPKF